MVWIFVLSGGLWCQNCWLVVSFAIHHRPVQPQLWLGYFWSLSQERMRKKEICRVPGRTTWTQCVLLPGTHRSARCMRLSLDTKFNPSPIYHWYVFSRNFIPSQMLSSDIQSCNFIYSATGILKLWEFYHSHHFAGNTQSSQIISFPARRGCSRRYSGHPTNCYLSISFSSPPKATTVLMPENTSSAIAPALA